MKYRLLELLACPKCGEGYECEEFETSENPDGQVEVDQGILRCPCGAWFPIVDAVPVILPNALDIYSDFAREYANRLPEWSISEEDIRRFEAEKKKTQESFGFEWTIYSTVRDERDEGYVLEGGLTPDFFAGKLVLDAGCGYGRHSRVVNGFGAEVVVNDRLMHGKTSPIKHDGKDVFADVPNPFVATRYHSLVVKRDTLPDCFEITAETEENEIMGLRHKEHPIWGVQFHPESILTESGRTIMKNFLSLGS